MGIYISSVDGSSDKVSKYQENLYYQVREVVSSPLRNPKRLRRDDQRALKYLKSEIESSKDKLFIIKHISAGSTQAKWYLVQMYMDQLYPVSVRYYWV